MGLKPNLPRIWGSCRPSTLHVKIEAGEPRVRVVVTDTEVDVEDLIGTLLNEGIDCGGLPNAPEGTFSEIGIGVVWGGALRKTAKKCPAPNTSTTPIEIILTMLPQFKIMKLMTRDFFLCHHNSKQSQVRSYRFQDGILRSVLKA